MDLKKILNETADRLESGKLAWTKNAYVLCDGEDCEWNIPAADLSACEVCAIGGCTVVAYELGEIELDEDGWNRTGQFPQTAVGVFESALRESLGSGTSNEIIKFNDEYALSAQSVAQKLREVAERL